jgi:hypothetical protein
MSYLLSRYVSETVLVAIPGVFADIEARRCRLVAAEQSGLWLVSAELAHAVQPRAKRAKTEVPPAIFVPFAQIAAIVPVAPEAAATVGLKPAAVAAESRPAAGSTPTTGSTPGPAATAAPKRSSTKTSKPPQ